MTIVNMIPPALVYLDYASTVGVVDNPISITLNPQAIKSSVTILLAINPDFLASLPIIITLDSQFCFLMKLADDVNLTISSGDSDSQTSPPIVLLFQI